MNPKAIDLTGIKISLESVEYKIQRAESVNAGNGSMKYVEPYIAGLKEAQGTLKYLESIALAKTEDKKRDDRLLEQKCIECYYSTSGTYTQAFCRRNCCYCQKEMEFSTGYTDACCESCAKSNNVCKHCNNPLD
jgi:hypothetical protein